MTAVSRPEDYDDVLAELRARGGHTSLETRRRLAGIAFATTAAYEAAIARWFGEDEQFPQTLIPVFEKVRDLAYGENPHQAAALYAERGVRSHLLSMVEQLHGRELSFNNLNDLNAARMLVREFALPACAIVKHANPCGVAVGATIEEAYERALAADPLSAYGGVVVLNRPSRRRSERSSPTSSWRCCSRPASTRRRSRRCVRKPATRILNDLERRVAPAAERDFKRVLGGLLVQERDWDVAGREGMSVVAGKPSEAQWGDLLFAWRVCKHVASNAIVIARDLQTLGIGAGQMSRVDAVRIALEKAREHGHSLDGAALASDAFFPFPDGPRLALDAGVTRADPAGRLEARRGRDLGRRECRRRDDLHRAPALFVISYCGKRSDGPAARADGADRHVGGTVRADRDAAGGEEPGGHRRARARRADLDHRADRDPRGVRWTRTRRRRGCRRGRR